MFDTVGAELMFRLRVRVCGRGASSFGVFSDTKTVLKRFLFECEETSRSSRVLEEQIFKSNKSFMHRVTFLNFSHF